MSTTSSFVPPDQPLRDRAIGAAGSFIVRAPAGSGKTELLTHRFLALLAVVDEPEQVLAVTFTRPATAEMRRRILGELEKARGGEGSDLANAALRHAEHRGWRLLEQPQRLNIQTIDSLCLAIAHRRPLLASLGGRLQPIEDARPLYAEAARRTLQQFGGGNAELNEALRVLLLHRDNNLADCERLLAEMLEKRDQWAEALLPGRDVDWDQLRVTFEKPFQRAGHRVLRRAHDLLSAEPVLTAELLAMIAHASQGAELKIDIGLLNGLNTLPHPAPEFTSHWECLTNLLLTSTGNWLKSPNKGHGFEPAAAGHEAVRAKQRMLQLLQRLSDIPGLLETLRAIRTSPPAHYDDAQWELLRHIFVALRRSVAELEVLFAERNEIDFVGIGLAAGQVLRAPAADAEFADAPSDLALALSDRMQHLLVDEFQDTSRRQHDLLAGLVRGWQPGDRRTCFFVGDPMQSIYLFRQAEVELFTRVQSEGIDCDGQTLELETIQLTTNFRSSRGIVEPLNDIFAKITAGDSSEFFSPSNAKPETSAETAVHIHADFVFGAVKGRPAPQDLAAARDREAAQVVGIAGSHLGGVEEARTTGGEFTVALLARAREHLVLIADALRRARIPFRAVELEQLNERQEILDLQALTRALTHPMDRVAWLALLRAPWCGLTLADLHILCGSDERTSLPEPMPRLLAARVHLLAQPGRERAQRMLSLLSQAAETRLRIAAPDSFSEWIERTWQSLGGPLCVDASGYENAQVFFRMLDQLPPDGMAALGEELDRRLETLFAQPDPDAGERCGVQLMTIHKAKGLAFDVVLVPGLERGTPVADQPLVCWLERVHTGRASEMLIAPIGRKGSPAQRLYKWVQEQKNAREAEERQRLLYVACTRARRELHLFGLSVVTRRQIKNEPASWKIGSGDPRSLLHAAWPALEAEFHEQANARPEFSPTPSDHVSAMVTFPHGVVPDDEVETLALAASAEPANLAQLRRLPLEELEGAFSADALENVTVSGVNRNDDEDNVELFRRPEGSRARRALGTAVHALLEKAAAMLAAGSTFEDILRSAAAWRRQAAALLRNGGVALAEMEEYLPLAMRAVDAALNDPHGRWILSPRPTAQSETAWTGWLDGRLRTLRVDRIFEAGGEPLAAGDDTTWIVDYKTAYRERADIETFLREEAARYSEQLKSYARILRLSRGGVATVRVALYYPLLGRFLPLQ